MFIMKTNTNREYEAAHQRSLERLKRGFDLGSTQPAIRDELHERWGRMTSDEKPTMISAAETKSEHSKAWGNESADAALPKLAERVKAAIEGGDKDPAHVINYAAILLDLHRNEAALDWLLAHPLEYREYYENLATAYAKTDSTKHEQIRANNGKSREVPSCPNSIVAYMDWQGL